MAENDRQEARQNRQTVQSVKMVIDPQVTRDWAIMLIFANHRYGPMKRLIEGI